MRAMSVLGNVKSDIDRKTHWVEPDGLGGKFAHLTRGGLGRESVREVSRGRSSVEACESRWSKGPKNRRGQSADVSLSRRRVALRNMSGAFVKKTSRHGAKSQSGGSAFGDERALASFLFRRTEVAEDA